MKATATFPTQHVTGLVDLRPSGGGLAGALDVGGADRRWVLGTWLAERLVDWRSRVEVAAAPPFRRSLILGRRRGDIRSRGRNPHGQETTVGHSSARSRCSERSCRNRGDDGIPEDYRNALDRAIRQLRPGELCGEGLAGSSGHQPRPQEVELRHPLRARNAVGFRVRFGRPCRAAWPSRGSGGVQRRLLNRCATEHSAWAVSAVDLVTSGLGC